MLLALFCVSACTLAWCVLGAWLVVGAIPGAWRTEEGRAWTWKSPRLSKRFGWKAATALVTQPVANRGAGSVTARHVRFGDPRQPRLRLHRWYGDRSVRGTRPMPLPTKSCPPCSSPGLLGRRRGGTRSGEPQRGPTAVQSATAWTGQAERALLSGCRRGRSYNGP